jgi:hypothetical protein
MNNIIETRKKVYNDFPKENLIVSLSDLVLSYDIKKESYIEIIEATKKFLLKSLEVAYNKTFIWTDTFLEDYDELISNLPNKTPNGLLNPKKETAKEFEQIQISLNNILNELGIYKHINQLAIPNIRYKSTLEPESAKHRPYYTSKHHSDAWVGHIGDSVFLIGLLGDIDNNTVEFNEPIRVKDNYLNKAESFEEGNTRYESLKYLGVLTAGRLDIMDHACIHRTLVKNNGKPRISMDFAVMINSEYSLAFTQDESQKRTTYYPPNIINSVGTEYSYEFEEPLHSTTTTLKLIKK